MPAKTEKQRKLMGAALACKRGEKCISPEVEKLAEGMTEEQLKDLASKPVAKKKKKK